MIEGGSVPITFNMLNTTSIPLLPNVNWVWVANHLCGFIGKCVDDIMLGRMTTLAGSEEFNGIELWRALFVEYRSASVEMTGSERGFFIDFSEMREDRGSAEPHCSMEETPNGTLEPTA